MKTDTPSDDAQAILLLCSTLALPRSSGELTPLSRSEWNEVARALGASRFVRPAALLGATAEQLRQELKIDPALADRMSALLERGGQLTIERSRLESLGIWVLTRVDEGYPRRLKDRLKGQAPPVLFGAGVQPGLNATGLAVVGSRDVDEGGAAVARLLGERCAAEGLAVFSGGARGVDQLAVNGCLDHGGTAIVVLAESLERTVKRREIGRSIIDERLTVVTPFHPSAGFTTAGAMARNKLIYALGSWAVVVSSALDSGGTWAGATENLRAGWVPLFVRSGPGVPAGNAELIARGAIPLDPDDVTDDLRGVLDQRPAAPTMVEPASMVREDAPAYPAGPPSSSPGKIEDAFTLAWPRLAAFLSTPRTEHEVGETFALDRAQAKEWLERAVRAGLAERTTDPINYRAVARATATPRTPLFDGLD